MSDKIFEDPVSSDEEAPVKDENTCNAAEISKSFGIKYAVATETALSLKRSCGLHLSLSSDNQNVAVGLSRKAVQIYNINKNGFSKDRFDINFDKNAVCGVKFFNNDPNLLMTAAAAGSVFMYDLRVNDAVFVFEEKSEGMKKTMTSFDINQNDRVLCASTDIQGHGDCFILFFDIRQRSYLGSYWECHSEDITRVKFHPENPDLLASGSLDGLINIFDISKSLEDDALKYCFNMEGCVENLNWHKNIDDKDLISCITTTNDLQIFNVEAQDLEIEFKRQTVTDCMKRTSAIDCNLINMHNQQDGGVFLLASSNYNKGECLRSLKLQNKKLTPYADFQRNKQLVRSSVYCEKENFLITTGESGMIVLWKSETTIGDSDKIHSNFKQKMQISHRVKPY